MKVIIGCNPVIFIFNQLSLLFPSKNSEENCDTFCCSSFSNGKICSINTATEIPHIPIINTSELVPFQAKRITADSFKFLVCGPTRTAQTVFPSFSGTELLR